MIPLLPVSWTHDNVSVRALSHVQLCDPRTAARQAPLSAEFFRHECWRGLPFPPPGDLPDPGIEPVFPWSPALVSRFLITVLPEKPQILVVRWNLLGILEEGHMVRGLGPNTWFVQIIVSLLTRQMT